MEYISIVCSILLCGVGVATFVIGLTAKSQTSGVMIQKLDQAVEGIEELKADLKMVRDAQHKSDIRIQSHEDQIKTLFKMVNSNERTYQVLTSIMEILNHALLGGDYHGVQH